MPRSLLSEDDPAAQRRLADADEVLVGWSSDWPQGHADARILEEYLAGRAAGDLDISGRAVADAVGGAAAGDVPVDETTHAPHAAASTAVLDDPDGSLALVVALTGARRTAVATDSASAGHACRAAFEALPESVRSAVGFHDSAAEAVAALVGESAALRVVVHAPKHVAVLREHLRLVEAFATEVVVVGREKHMSPSLNRLLAESYERLDVSPGRAKSRLLIASGPKRLAPLRRESTDDRLTPLTRPRIPVQSAASSPAAGVPEIQVSAYPGAFGGASADPGSRILLTAFARRLPTLVPGGGDGRTGETGSVRVLDLGSGNGWLLAAIGSLLPHASLFGVDDSRAAVESTALTAASVRPGEEPALVRHVDATRPLPWRTEEAVDHAGAGGDGEGPTESVAFAEGSFDLVTLNPPFHDGTSMTTDIAHDLIDAAADLLRPGGRLVIVYNSHLRYRSHLQHRFSDVEQWARDRRFTVVSATRPGSARGETRTPTS
ncbi:class I SAM-dependent methyltransferase [Brevibacterium jeotgali]|uniref:class I SAM-dependent methyltransferase n=1 Tax=Brevibacterium jeotgali TaxID=1262550 RepID=UPI000C78852F|nr:methyltransferase [Brevibacterium jeotgali]